MNVEACAEWLLAGCPLLGLACNVTAQAAMFRLLPRAGLLRSIYMGFAVGIISAVCLVLLALLHTQWPTQDAIALIILQIGTTAILGYGYFHFLNLGETARRVRLLRELLEAGGTLTEDELLRRYSADELIHQRLGRLLRSGQVVLDNGRYHIGDPTILRISQALQCLQRLLLRRG